MNRTGLVYFVFFSGNLLGDDKPGFVIKCKIHFLSSFKREKGERRISSSRRHKRQPTTKALYSLE